MDSNEFFDTFFRWIWVASAILGLLLFVKGRVPGARLLGSAMLCSAAGGAIFAYMAFSVGPENLYSYFNEFPLSLRPWLGVADFVLLTLGVLALVGIWRPRGAAATTAADTSEAGETGETLMVRRHSATSLDKAEELRDRMLDLFERNFTQSGGGARMVTFKSSPGTAEPWWLIEYEVAHRDGWVMRRATITWVCTRHDFHRFPVLGRLTVKDSRASNTWHGIIELTDTDAKQVWQHLQGNGRKLRLKPRRVRLAPWQLWREKNDIQAIRRFTWGAVILPIGLMLGLLFLPLLILVLLGMGIYGFVMRLRHPHRYIQSAGKPLQDPRTLRMLANWHSNVYGLGHKAPDIFIEMQKHLSASVPSDVKIGQEVIWYYGPDGKVERTQLVVNFRRVMAFVQVDGYGQDMHVGWDGHINLGTWAEVTVASGTHKATGEPVELRTFAPGVHTANEYDYTDAAFLIEWVHAKVTQLVKRKMKEHQIDQEIDFKIVRDVPDVNAAPAGAPQAQARPSRLRRVS